VQNVGAFAPEADENGVAEMPAASTQKPHCGRSSWIGGSGPLHRKVSLLQYIVICLIFHNFVKPRHVTSE
jgi:hypothetical protein